MANRTLARQYEQGSAIKRDRSRGTAQVDAQAIAIYFERCVRSPQEWCQNLWFNVEREVPGVAEDMEAARSLYRDACAAGDSASCGDLGWLLGFRYISLPDEHAAAVLEQACQHGVRAACRDLASFLRPDTLLLPSDDARVQRVAKLYGDACNAGDVEACTGLAERIHDGRGPLGTTDADAVRLLRGSCTRGDPVACLHLAMFERDGRGTPHDDRATEHHFRLACAQHEMEACFELQIWLNARPGGIRDADAQLAVHACDAGVLQACPTP